MCCSILPSPPSVAAQNTDRWGQQDLEGSAGLAVLKQLSAMCENGDLEQDM